MRAHVLRSFDGAAASIGKLCSSSNVMMRTQHVIVSERVPMRAAGTERARRRRARGARREGRIAASRRRRKHECSIRGEGQGNGAHKGLQPVAKAVHHVRHCLDDEDHEARRARTRGNAAAPRIALSVVVVVLVVAAAAAAAAAAVPMRKRRGCSSSGRHRREAANCMP